MKINRVRLQDFRIHKELEVPLDNVTVVVGANGTGKSSIKAALEYALTGRCEWTDGRGAGAEGLIRDGAKKAVVALDVDGVGLVQRTVPNALEVEGFSGNTTTQQAALMEKVGATEQVIAAALNTTGFLALDPAAQKRLLFDLLGFSYRRDDVVKRVEDYFPEVASRPAAGAWIRSHIPETAYGPEAAYGPEVFAELETRAVGERRARKRDLKDLEALAKTPTAARLPEGVTLTDEPAIREQLSQLQRQRDELMKRLGDAQAVVRARESHGREIERLRATVASAEKDLALLKSGPEDLQKLRVKVKEARSKITTAMDEQSRVGTARAAADAKRGSLKAAMDGIGKATGACPLAPELVQCPMSSDDVQKVLANLREDLGAAEREVRRAEKATKELADRIARLWREESQFAGEVDRLDRAQNTLASSRALLAQMEQTRADVGEVPDLAKLEADIATLGTRITRGEDLLSTLQRYTLAQEAQKDNIARWTRCQEEVTLLEALCEALGPKGIRARILGEAVGALLEHADRRCRDLTGGEYSIDFRVSEDLEILVTREGFAPRSVRELSTSERFRVGLVVQDLLNSLTGLRLWVIDGADVLDVTNRALMMDTLLLVREDYDTILVLSALGDVEPADPGIPGVSVYVLRDGGLVAARRAA